MADPIRNFFKSTLVGTYSDSDTSLTLATGDGALLPDPSTDGAFNLTIFEGLQVTGSTTFEIVRVTARSGDVLTVTRGQESTTPLTIGSATHSILMSATKKTFDDINDAIDSIELADQSLNTTSDVEFNSVDVQSKLVLPIKNALPESPTQGELFYYTPSSSVVFFDGNVFNQLSGDILLQLGLAELSVTANGITLSVSADLLTAQATVSALDATTAFTGPATRETEVGSLTTTANDASAVFGYVFQGTSFGYASGGQNKQTNLNIIEKFSYTSDANGTDVGDLTSFRRGASGTHSDTHGYTAGGGTSTNGATPTNIIDKFPFASDTNASDVGDLVTSFTFAGSTGASSSNHGYTFYDDGAQIQKHSFSADGNATDVGDLTVARYVSAGQSSSSHGYSAGGFADSASNVIDKVSFSADGNATDVGDLTTAVYGPAGSSSSTHGYSAGGWIGSASNIIEKHSFASDGNATDVADMFNARYISSGTSSTSHGYQAGGTPSGSNSNNNNVISKNSFASDVNGTDVGDLTTNSMGRAGQNV